MMSNEKILYTLKKNKEYREFILEFAKRLSNQPKELLEATLDLFLEEKRKDYLDKFEGKRSMTALKYLWDAETISVPQVQAEMTSRRQEEEAAEKLKKKTLLIKNIKPCPACESEDTYLHERRENNGVMGPGHSSWVVESYWVCDDCGIHFTPKDKTK